MTTKEKVEGLPVRGYVAQSPEAIDMVNINKEVEERLLRILDMLEQGDKVDKRWLAIGRTHIEQGFLAINRAIFKSVRTTLPEDVEEALKIPDDVTN